MGDFLEIIGIILLAIAFPNIIFWGGLYVMYKFPDWADGKSSTKQSNSTPKTSTPNFSKKQEPNQSPPDKKASTSAQSQKPLSPPQKSDALKDIDFQQIVKSPSFDGARAQMSQLYKEKQKEKEPVDYLQKYSDKPSSEIKCDSMGNIKTSSQIKGKDSANKIGIVAAIIIVCVAFFAILFGIIFSVIREQEPPPTVEHTHEYVNGQCVSCSAYDDFYYWPKYQSILDIMDSMNEPIKDMVTIQSKLKDIPTDYKQAKKITAQCNTLYDLCSTIRNESIKEKPDYQKIQTTLFTICEKRDNKSYSLWNLSSIINSFFDTNLYANTSTVWGLLYGHWECSSGYYISYDGEYVSTNFPHPISHLTNYYLPVHGLEIYVCESSNEWGSNAFRIKSIDKNWILFYCYSNDSTYILTPKSPASGSSGSSSPDISTRYIGNIETKKFHYSWCSYLPDSENRTSLYGRASAISQGYSPCEHCNP